ncbi:LCP family protein [Nocardioides sp.]|uniref:LCP family protein n=1 Tax=Nocardioides sp. TaxID=35761 RepID=UPI003514F948
MKVRLALAAVLTGVGVLVPDAAPAATYAHLVRTDVGAEIGAGRGVATGTDVIWILAVGSDARPGEDMLRVRGDALQLVGIDTRTGAATSIGIPRDSYVAIPDVGSDRVNAALYYGGPQLLARTVAEMVGIAPDYVFVTTFPLFEEMVNDIGPITVRNPVAFSDPYLKPNGFPVGRLELRGYNAMAFARIRKSLIGGDFDRSANQQRVLRGIQARVAERAQEPGFLADGVLSVLEHTETDANPAELFRLAVAMAQVDPRRITGCVVTGGYATINGASVVTPDLALAQRLGDDARDDAEIEEC